MNKSKYLEELEMILIDNNVDNTFTILYDVQLQINQLINEDKLNEEEIINIIGTPLEYSSQFIRKQHQYEDSQFINLLLRKKDRDNNNIYAIIIIGIFIFNSSFSSLNIFPWSKPLTTDFTTNQLIFNVLSIIVILILLLRFSRKKK